MDDDPDLLRERLRRAGHPAVMGPTRLRVSGRRPRNPGAMTEHSHSAADVAWPHLGSAAARADQYPPGAPIPHPTAAQDGSTGWGAPAGDYAGRADGRSSWGGLDAPSAVPPPIAGTVGPQTRPGWLAAGRVSGEPVDDAH